jgi:hypothetical protein
VLPARPLGVADASKLIEFYFTVWRKSGSGGYDRIGITDNLRGDISDGINEIKLNEPISEVQEGDYYGYRIKTSGPALYIDIHETRLTYYVNNIIPDTTDPVILTAAAEPDEIEADGIDNTLLNVNAIDIDSGIAFVTVNLLALNGPLVQQMTNNNGLWQLAINTTVIGEFSLPVNVTDNAGNSNTSVNILLNARDTISPVISCPDDMLVEQDVSENIIWIITEIHPDKYWIMRNSTLVEPPADYQNGEPISISINTSTLGIWNYTIIANDTSGYMTIDQVNISIVSNWRDEWMGENSIGGNVVTTSELQDAIHHWLENIPVGDYTLSTPDLQEVIAVWLLE